MQYKMIITQTFKYLAIRKQSNLHYTDRELFVVLVKYVILLLKNNYDGIQYYSQKCQKVNGFAMLNHLFVAGVCR